MKVMKLRTVVELPTFMKKVDSVLLRPEEKEALINYVAAYPERGDEIPRTGGLRKLRWGSKGKGKRGGARVIYYFYDNLKPVFLLSIYGKNTKENLSSEEERHLSKLAVLLKEECKR